MIDDLPTILDRERLHIVELLDRARVAIADAEDLVISAILDWNEAGRERELIRFVDARCREYAGKRQRNYFGLQETEKLIAKARRARSIESKSGGAPRPLAPESFTNRGPPRCTKKMGRRRRVTKGPGRG
jgi:hypothetical protein